MTPTQTTLEMWPRLRRHGGPDVRSAVSLHSHSEHSCETLDFVPGLAAKIPLIATLVARTQARNERRSGNAIDFAAYYWRPPLGASEVVASEREHLERRLDLPSFVSLTDHDTLAGARVLAAAGEDVPRSIEWSVTSAGALFHLGVHGIPAARVDEAERVLNAFTFHGEGSFDEIADWLIESPETVVVVNHPYWDMAEIGSLRHDAALLAFLRRHHHRVHALELNGYRPWSENRRVLPLAEGFGLPVVGGGDRHGRSPNTIVNLTAATTFAEFASDLRSGLPTRCVIFPEYARPFRARLLQGAAECLAPVAASGGGSRRWTERVFKTVDGTEVPLTTIWNGPPLWLRAGLGATRLLGSAAGATLLQLARPGASRVLTSDPWARQFMTGPPARGLALQVATRLRETWSGATTAL